MQSSSFDNLSRSIAGRRLTRRGAMIGSGAITASALALHGQRATLAQDATPAATPAADPAIQAAEILAMAQEAIIDKALKSVILRVTVNGEELVTQALGESMTGVPATVDMHFRNGA